MINSSPEGENFESWEFVSCFLSAFVHRVIIIARWIWMFWQICVSPNWGLSAFRSYLHWLNLYKVNCTLPSKNSQKHVIELKDTKKRYKIRYSDNIWFKGLFKLTLAEESDQLVVHINFWQWTKSFKRKRMFASKNFYANCKAYQ